ncbi:MAG: hypothetical protein ACREBK_01750 [Sphingomicrobium sp.]
MAWAPFLLAGCATVAAEASLAGQWGGQHIGLKIGATKSSLEYDCAAGTIDGPLVADASGRFTARGSHIPGTGGPVQAGATPRSYPAVYSGSVRGDTMTLVVDVPSINVRIGPMALRRGAEPILLHCL